jgi:glutaredoxin 3
MTKKKVPGKTPKIEIYTASYCPYCTRAKELLTSKNVEFISYDVEHDDLLRQECIERSGRRTIPQIFIDNFHVGGFDDLYALDQSKKLDPLLHTHD